MDNITKLVSTIVRMKIKMPIMYQSFCCGASAEDGTSSEAEMRGVEARDGITDTDNPELFQYFYHSIIILLTRLI